MVFKRMLGSLGVGGPTADAVLDGGAVLPGGSLSGHVHLQGGNTNFHIEHISLELVARVEAEYDDGEHEGFVAFDRHIVSDGFRLAKGEQRSIPFTMALPWEIPVTELQGQPLGVELGVRTELAIKGARDKGDLDPFQVRPLPIQEAILEALRQLGFGFKSADLELGHVRGTGQQLPFYQEIELAPAPQYAEALNEIELTFLAGPGGMEVVLEASRRGGLLSDGHDTVSCFTVTHEGVDEHDWNAEVDGWIRRIVEHRSSHTHAGHGHGDHHGSEADEVAEELVDEIGDALECDEEEEGAFECEEEEEEYEEEEEE
jgi:sporulation-control protein